MLTMTPVLDLASLQSLQGQLNSFSFGLELWQFGTPISATLHENSWSTYDSLHEPVFFGEHDHSVNDGGSIRTLSIDTTLGHLDLSSFSLYHGTYDHYDYIGGLDVWNGSNQSYTVNTLQFTANPIPVPVAPNPYYLFGVEKGADLGDKFDFGCLPVVPSPMPPSTLTSLAVVDVHQDNFQFGGWSVQPDQGIGIAVGGSWTDDVSVNQHTAIGATLNSLFDDARMDVTHVATSEYHNGDYQVSSLHTDTNMVHDAHWTAIGVNQGLLLAA